MGIREDITSLEVSLRYPVEMPKSTANAIREALCRLLAKAADLAEARERDLSLDLENERRENELLKESVMALKAERAQMIAELRELCVYESQGRYNALEVDYESLKAIINKYEALK